MVAAIHSTFPVLNWSIGDLARERLQRTGFTADVIDLLVGASGGPKWLVLAGLDRALFGAFLPARSRPLSTLSSSIGSWRFAVMAQRNPISALDRFLAAYLEQHYSNSPTPAQVSAVLRDVLTHLLGGNGVNEILSSPRFRNHVVTIRSRGILASENKWKLASGLACVFLANLFGRDQMGAFCQRVTFRDSRDQALPFGDKLPTLDCELTVNNLQSVLEASGAVPLVLEGVSDINGAPAGIYRDGGVTDYHFDYRVASSQGTIFYPHFYSSCTPGWFDKGLSWRKQNVKQWTNLIMVSPTQEFVSRLPGGKIPDRKDFLNMEDKQRMAYWKTVVSESDRLGDAFLAAVDKQDFF